MKKKLKLCILGTGFGNIAHIPSFHQNNKVGRVILKQINEDLDG